MEGLEEVEEEEVDIVGDMENNKEGVIGEEDGEISLHPLQGCLSSKIIKVKATVGKR